MNMIVETHSENSEGEYIKTKYQDSSTFLESNFEEEFF